MIRKCDVCGQKLSHYEEKCPKCGAEQQNPGIIRKAGKVFRRLIKPFGAQTQKGPKR